MIDLSTSRRIHIIAIGGTGMSAIAGVLLDMGHIVSGSDANASPYLDRVIKAGANAWVGHDAAKMPADIEAVVISTAISGYGRLGGDWSPENLQQTDNPELAEALRRRLPILNRAEILASIAATRRTVAVAGTHGKTTTSTLLAVCLEAGGVKPSYVIGGELLGRDGGSHWAGGPWFVVEADESDATFLKLGAEAALVTNIEPDHLQTYGGWEQLKNAFKTFISSSVGARVVCIDNAGVATVTEGLNVTTYGQSQVADYRIVNLQMGRFSVEWNVVHEDENVSVTLPTAGLHNALNATGAMVMAHQIGVPLIVSAAGLANYGGVGRRFQKRGEIDGITFIDDYAHLPSEVHSALSAAKDGNWQRIVAIFQPHRYSRTQEVGNDFVGAFDNADLLVLTDVYAAGEKPIEGIDGKLIRRAVESGDNHPPVSYIADRSELAREINKILRPGDLCITLGAGDITKLADEIQALRS